MPQFLLSLYQRMVGSWTSRLPVGSASKRATVDAVLWQLEEVAYSRLKDQGFRPGCVIDIGAHIGRWTRLAKTIFSDSPFVMIEAREEMRADLERTAAALRDVSYYIALLGPRDCDGVTFHVQGSASSVYSERSDTQMTATSIPMTTLDKILPRTLCSPLFMKLDVQGSELDILRGATSTLEITEVIQLEVALLPYNEGAPTSSEVIKFMDDHGFVIYDIAGFVRPNRKDLVQVDILFVRKESNLRPQSFQFGSK